MSLSDLKNMSEEKKKTYFQSFVLNSIPLIGNISE